MTRADRTTIRLLQYLSEALDEDGCGFTQYFSFEIRGKTIRGQVKVEVEEREVLPIRELAKQNQKKSSKKSAPDGGAGA